MREIVSVQVGQCGNQIGSQFWQTVCEQHGISPDQNYPSGEDKPHRPDVFFEEVSTNNYMSRCVLADQDEGVLDSVKGGRYGRIFRCDNFISNNGGGSGNYARGRYSQAHDIRDPALEAARREAERCDSLQAFQMVYSLGGGTGSGFGTLLMSLIDDHYYLKKGPVFTVFPSATVSDTVTEPYNTVLALHQLVQDSIMTPMLDNEALYNICQRSLKINHPSYSHINSIIAQAMSTLTCSVRFPGQLNSSIRKLQVNTVPFPRLHFLTLHHAPITSSHSHSHMLNKGASFADISGGLVDNSNCLSDVDIHYGRLMSGSLICRGQVSFMEVEKTVAEWRNKHLEHYMEWIPGNVQTVLCDMPSKLTDVSALLIGTNTACKQLFKRIAEQYSKLFRRKAFLHWYTSQGMDEMEFVEAESNVNDLVSQYQSYGDSSAEYQDQIYDDQINFY